MAEPGKIDQRTLEKLEWPLLVERLAGLCQTDEGRDNALSLTPDKDRATIQTRWELVEPLRNLARQGYKTPIGILPQLVPVFRAATLGQVLAGPDLRAVATLLEATRKVHAYASDFASRCSTLRSAKSRLYPMPALLAEILRAVGPDGELNDDASETLTTIRRQKVAVRKRVEETLRKLIHEAGDLADYLQDDFFTVRSERYVVPMRIDGRGRVKGAILDTSSSGQTLFIEPAAIQPINDQLLDLEVEEKLEILRIFRELSAKVGAEAEMLRGNYAELVALDNLTAEGVLAADIDAGPVVLSDRPVLDLHDARHPLVKRRDGKAAVGNRVALEDGQCSLIVSGPNAGGKTVVLKSVGLLHLMARAALLVPCDPNSRMYLFDRVWLEMGDAQNLSANLSTFSGHLLGLKPILEKANGKDLVLLDELAVGTDPQTGSAIGTAILEDLADKRATVIVTTHFDALKSLGLGDKRFRNGSMEFSLHSLLPTYRLILDVPGQSYGLEVAEQMGLPARIVGRAKDLRQGQMSNLDRAVNQLMEARDEAREARATADKEKLEAEALRVRFDQEVEMLKEARRKAALQLADKYESVISNLRQEFDAEIRKMRQAVKDVGGDQNDARNAALEGRRGADKALRDLESTVGGLAQGPDIDQKLPGQPVARTALSPGTPVFVLPLKKAGKVVKVAAGADDSVEVEVGVIKLRVSSHDLRLLSPGEAAGGPQGGKKNQPQPPKKGPPPPSAPAAGGNREIGLTLQTQTNSLDLRGRDADDAVKSTWDFIDRALLRGEPAVVIIHGHGTGVLMRAIRDALRHDCPYDVRWRPGLDQEGGDGVTIVELKT